mmetsp:Transcript_65205/g.79813  ORF Transcript_65205/g.79813 Transcript_65205/m.79813 type:complete len:358 (+) Transcript_65205:46-1119(+)
MKTKYGTLNPKTLRLKSHQIPESYEIFEEKRKCCDECKKFVSYISALLLSKRTLFIQFEAFLCIFLLTNIKLFKDNFVRISEIIDINVITTVLSFTIVFIIGQQFLRRERTLSDISALVSHITMICWTWNWMQNQKMINNNDNNSSNDIRAKLETHHLVNNMSKYNINHSDEILQISYKILYPVSKYLLDHSKLLPLRLYSQQQFTYFKQFIKAVYELHDKCFSCELDNKVFWSHHINGILKHGRDLLQTKLYKTPLGIRSFSEIGIFVLPVLISPYFVWNKDGQQYSHFSSYFWGYIFFFMYGTLVGIEAKLDDLFDADCLDDIVLHYDEIINNIAKPMNTVHKHFGKDDPILHTD